MTIFGIFSIDNFGIEFITNFIKEIRVITSSIVEYLSNTNFYNYLNKLFNKNKVIDEITSSEKIDKIRPLIRENTTETIRNETSIETSGRNTKISE
jgi:regulator of sigma D